MAGKLSDYSAQEWEAGAKSLGVTVQELQNEYLEKTRPALTSFDPRNQPAPLGVGLLSRMSAGDPFMRVEDQLEQVKRLYPTAELFRDERGYPSNISIAGDEGDNRYLFNPPGLDVGDVAQAAPKALSQTVGGVAGGLLGTPFGPGGTIAGAAIGGTGAGAIHDYLTALMRRQPDRRSLMEHGVQQGIDFGAEALGQRFGLAAFNQPLKRFHHLLNRMAINRVGRGPGEVVRQIDEMGIPLGGSIAAATGDKSVGNMVDWLAKRPGSSDVMSKAFSDTYLGIRRARDRFVGRLGGRVGSKKADIGERAQTYAENAIGRFETNREALDDVVAQAIPAGTPAQQRNVLRFYEQNYEQLMDAPGHNGYLTDSVNQARRYLEDGGISFDEAGRLLPGQSETFIPFQYLRKARTHLGREINWTGSGAKVGLVNDSLRNLYHAMRRDIQQTAQRIGDDAIEAVRGHDGFVSSYAQLDEFFLTELQRAGVDQAYRYMKTGGKKGRQSLEALRRQFTPKEWGDISGSLLYEMGQPSKGQAGGEAAEAFDFSVARFTTEWNDLRDRKLVNVLFGRPEHRDLIPALNSLSDVTAAFKAAERNRNLSNTASATWLNYLFGGTGAVAALYGAGEIDVSEAVTGGLAGLGTSVLAPRIAAKVITNPRFVRWLARAYQIPVTNYNGWAAHIGRLGAIGAQPGMSEAITEITHSMEDFIKEAVEPYRRRGKNGN